MAPKVHVVTPAERELRRKYELLRKKKEARAAGVTTCTSVSYTHLTLPTILLV